MIGGLFRGSLNKRKSHIKPGGANARRLRSLLMYSERCSKRQTDRKFKPECLWPNGRLQAGVPRRVYRETISKNQPRSSCVASRVS